MDSSTNRADVRLIANSKIANSKIANSKIANSKPQRFKRSQTPSIPFCSAFFRLNSGQWRLLKLQASRPRPNETSWRPVTDFVFTIVFAAIILCFSCQTDALQNRTQDRISTSRIATSRIATSIEQLSSENPLVRENAKANLKLAGSAAYGQLEHNRRTGSLESQLLIEELLQQIKFSWFDANDLPSVKNLMFNFADRKTADRIAIVDQLAILPAKHSWNALIKIVQFDREPKVSNSAARACLQTFFIRDGSTKQTAIQFAKSQELIRFDLPAKAISAIESDSVRAVAFVFYLAKKLEQLFGPRANDNTKDGNNSSKVDSDLNENQMIANLLAGFPNPLRKPVLQTAYELCGQSSDAAQFIDQRCLEVIESDRIELLESTVEAFFYAGRLELIIELFQKNPDLVQRKWIMPFVLAESHYLRGENELGNKIVSWAVSQSSPYDTEKQRLPVLNAIALESNGLIHSAEHLLGSDEKLKSLPTHLRLATYEIRIGKLNSAYDRIQTILESPQVITKIKSQSFRLLSEIAGAKNDVRQELDWLKKALNADPANAANAVRFYLAAQTLSDIDKKIAQQRIDVCIGIQRDRNRKAGKMEQSSIPAERNIGKKTMQKSSNALAWLLANTSEDIEEALNFARRAAVEPMQDSSILDTLAFCYFKSGNQKAAIIAQRQAVFLKPFDKGYRQRLRKYEEK